MFRLAVAIIAGAIFTSVIAFCADAVAADLLRVFPYLDLALAFPYGICGGLLAARLAPEKGIGAGSGVAALTVLVGLVSYRMNGSPEAAWFWIAMSSSLAGGAMFGGHLGAMRAARARALQKRPAKVRKAR